MGNNISNDKHIHISEKFLEESNEIQKNVNISIECPEDVQYDNVEYELDIKCLN